MSDKEMAVDKSTFSVEEVKRFSFFAYMDDDVAELERTEEPDGGYVLASDFDRITEALRGELTACLLARSQEQESISSRVEYNFLEAERDQLRAEVELLTKWKSEQMAVCGPILITPENLESVSLAEALRLAGRVSENQLRFLKVAKAKGKEMEPVGRMAAAPAPVQAEPASPWVAVSERLPESERTVLAYYLNSHNKGRRIRAEYIAAKTKGADDGWDEEYTAEYDEETDQYFWPAGWYEVMDNWDGLTHVAVVEGDVTHWMPLPKSPEASK